MSRADRVACAGLTADEAVSAKELAVIQFQKFLHENFAGPKQVARAFYVEERTAENWWSARNRASAEVIMMAFGIAPTSAMAHLRLVIDNPQPVETPRATVRAVA